jgi:hypothetical protein
MYSGKIAVPPGGGGIVHKKESLAICIKIKNLAKKEI